jgi:ATP-binding cassette subfamily A (ABC1) protein 3
MEMQKSKLSVADYGLSVTTLEEVFLLVASAERETGKSVEDASGSRAVHGLSESIEVEAQSLAVNEMPGELDVQAASKTLVFCGQFAALFAKRYNYAKRDLKNLICQVVVPAFLVLLGLILLTVFQFASIEGGPELVLDPAQQFNPDLGEELRNFVPIRVPQPAGSNADAEAIVSQFNMAVVKGEAVRVDDPLEPDAFDGCAQPASSELTVMSNFLLSDANYAQEPSSDRYGAVTIHDSTNAATQTYAYNILVNATARDAAPMFINLVHTGILRAIDGAANPGASITVSNKPLPLTQLQNDISQSSDAFSTATYVVIAFAFLPASYAIFVVRERETGAKHQQLISGVSLPAYWLATYLWDAASYLIPSGLSILMFVAFGVDAYTTGEGLTATVLLFLLYGPAVAAQTYCFSYLFKSHSTAQNIVLLLNFLCGLALMITSFVLDALENTRELNQTLKHFFRLLPPFCLGNGLTQLSFCQDLSGDGEVLCPTNFFSMELKRPLDFDVAGLNIVYLASETVIYFLICLLIEVGLTFPAFAALFDRVRDPGHSVDKIDSDVSAEAERVLSGKSSGECVRLERLRKVYNSPVGPKVAVQNLTFGIPAGECFGFLGINGP